MLEAAGLNVFYDDDEKANLWGKDLYVHLSDVYQNQAQYCILFASKEYATKNWPSHERQSAQARALREKGNEYILPVRFDDTDIPGIPPTIGYLDFRREGPEGICKAFLRKIGAQQPTKALSEVLVCESSPRALVTFHWIQSHSRQLPRCHGRPIPPFCFSNPTTQPTVLLDRLRQQRDHLIVAFSNNAGVGSVTAVEHIVAGGRQQWKIEIQALQSDFSSTTEMGTSGITAEQFAEIRAKRILLNQHRYEETQDYNKVMREILTQGQGAAIKIDGSSFPALYKEYGTQPSRFLQIAWISAVMQAKLSNTVVSVDHLRLGLKGSLLTVEFRGARARKFTNVSPHLIKIEGEIDLRS